MSYELQLAKPAYQTDSLRRAGINVQDSQMSEVESADTQHTTLSFRLSAASVSSQIHHEQSAARRITQYSSPDYTMSAEDQVALGRSLEDYYLRFEDWELECHDIYLQYEKDLLEYNREYLGNYEERSLDANLEGPMPYMPQEPVFPTKPDMPIPPSNELRALVNTAESSKNRMEPIRGYGIYARFVNETKAVAGAWFSAKSAKSGISKKKKKKKDTRSTKSSGGRSEAVDRALKTLEFNVITNSGNCGKEGVAEAALEQKAKVQCESKWLLDQQGKDVEFLARDFGRRGW
ncbi:uncharacterized protein RAG0_04088 [Rhynchosporium agropyri]|uniref:Uncharacterized protein n=1 Tax=Rhynchosporium agropyri TaxID=914238 RepID=A0A1E1K7J8_9HELO|nr:uncharacterized protein RAG0_04088 [Rhynchosporium agropyri]